MATEKSRTAEISEIKNKIKRNALYKKEKIRKAKEKRQRKLKRKREETQDQEEVSDIELPYSTSTSFDLIKYTCLSILLSKRNSRLQFSVKGL